MEASLQQSSDDGDGQGSPSLLNLMSKEVKHRFGQHCQPDVRASAMRSCAGFVKASEDNSMNRVVSLGIYFRDSYLLINYMLGTLTPRGHQLKKEVIDRELTA